MELVVAIVFLIMAWLTLLTFKLKKQKRENNLLKRNNKIYLRELLKLGYGKEDQETKG